MASNEPPSLERNQNRSPPPPEAVVEEAITAAEVARRTCPVCMRLFDSAKAMWGHSWVHREKRDQIHSMGPPAPPPGGVAVVAVGPTDGVVLATTGSGWHPWKIDSRDERDRTCPRCAKVFNSPKAMFGHLHVHYERSPSRRAKGEGSSNQPELVQVQIERPVVVVPNNKEEINDGVEESDSPVSIDLNRPIRMEEDNGGDEDSSASSIDLNKMPPTC